MRDEGLRFRVHARQQECRQSVRSPPLHGLAEGGTDGSPEDEPDARDLQEERGLDLPCMTGWS